MAVSSLLRSAAATRDKIRSQEDALVAYQWQSSAQTFDDWLAYQAYLSDRIKTSTGATDILSYQTKLRSAFTSYTSNEIQRQSIAIQNGSGTIETKMATVASLYEQAYANGDLNLAQNLEAQWNTLSIQQQNQLKSSASSNLTAQKAALKAQVSDALDSYQGLATQVDEAYRVSTNPGEWQQSIAKINANLPANMQLPEGVGYFDMLATLSEAAKQTLVNAIQIAPDTATAETFNKQLAKYDSGDAVVATVNGGEGKTIDITTGDLEKQIAAAQIGETYLRESTFSNGNGWVKQDVQNYIFSHDANGNVVAVPSYTDTASAASAAPLDVNGNPITSVKTQEVSIYGGAGTGNEQTVSVSSYADLLESQGFTVKEQNGAMTVTDNTGAGRLDGENSVQVFVDANGNLQYASTLDNTIKNFSFDENGAFVGLVTQTDNPFVTAARTTTGRNADSPYVNQYLSQNPELQQQVVDSAGLLTKQTLSEFDRQAITANNNPTLSGAGLTQPSRFSSPTQVLQGAATLAQNQQTIQQQQVPQLQASPVPQIQLSTVNPANVSSRATISTKQPTVPSATISTKPVTTKTVPKVKVDTSVPNFSIGF